MTSNAQFTDVEMPVEGSRRPAVVFIGRSRIPHAPGDDYRHMLRILARHVRPIIVGTGQASRTEIEGVIILVLPSVRPPLLGGIVFYALGPFVAVASALRRHAGAIVCQSPYEAAGTLVLARLLPSSVRPRVVIDTHGDWQLAPRLYGMWVRRLLAPGSDRLAISVLRRADWVRTTSAWLARKVRRAGYTGPIDRTIAYSNFQLFLGSPLKSLPERPLAVFVGVLDRVKGVDTLLEAWVQIVAQISAAQLRVVGDGPQSPMLKRRAKQLGIDASVTFTGAVPRATVRSFIDDACLLVLPSYSEGFGRIIIEAMARGRPVVASKVGAIPELVEHGTTGVLVPPGNSNELARAITALISDRVTLTRMSQAARAVALSHDPAERFEASLARLALWVGG
jgi:glycosyltransferase involved in cell wall biosynthesis